MSILPVARENFPMSKATAAGRDVTFYQVLGAHHGGPEFWTTQVLDLVEAFIIRAVERV